MQTEIIFLGTGTSTGIPLIGCPCAVCQSTDPRDQRLRTAIFVKTPDVHLVIDTGPDFRQQMLLNNITRLDAILYTHDHQDHIIGLDDVRPFNLWQQKTMPIYATERVQNSLKRVFSYAFGDNPYPGSPTLTLHTIHAHLPFVVANHLPINPIEVIHGNMPILGFRIGDFTYITDASHIAPAEIDKIRGSKVVVLNALRHDKHWSHFTLQQAIDIAQQIGAPQTYFTHASHQIGLYTDVQASLPKGMFLAYDRLKVVF